MSAAGATKDEISVFLERLEKRQTVALPITDMGGAMTDAVERRQVADDDGFSLVGGSPTKYAAGSSVVASNEACGAGTGMIPCLVIPMLLPCRLEPPMFTVSPTNLGG